jgi:membrane protease YdiL (CAAX protease family)
VWTAFVGLIAVLLGSSVFGLGASALLVAVAGKAYDPVLGSDAALTKPSAIGLLVLLAVTQVATIGLVLRMASRSPTSAGAADRLALVTPNLSGTRWLAVCAGSLAVTLCAMLAMHAAGVSPDRSVLDQLLDLRGPLALASVIVGAFLVPPAEELLFRGYVQTRLVVRWGPAWGIGITAFMFALAHWTTGGLAHVGGVVPLALWLGWLAWRTGSILPSIAAHVTVNFVLISLAVTWPEAIMAFDRELPRVAAGLALPLAAAAAWLLLRHVHRAPRTVPAPPDAAAAAAAPDATA